MGTVKTFNDCCEEKNIDLDCPCEDDVPAGLPTTTLTFKKEDESTHSLNIEESINFDCCDGQDVVTVHDVDVPNKDFISFSIVTIISQPKTYSVSFAVDFSKTTPKDYQEYKATITLSICGQLVEKPLILDVQCNENCEIVECGNAIRGIGLSEMASVNKFRDTNTFALSTSKTALIAYNTRGIFDDLLIRGTTTKSQYYFAAMNPSDPFDNYTSFQGPSGALAISYALQFHGFVYLDSGVVDPQDTSLEVTIGPSGWVYKYVCPENYLTIGTTFNTKGLTNIGDIKKEMDVVLWKANNTGQVQVDAYLQNFPNNADSPQVYFTLFNLDIMNDGLVQSGPITAKGFNPRRYILENNSVDDVGSLNKVDDGAHFSVNNYPQNNSDYLTINNFDTLSKNAPITRIVDVNPGDLVLGIITRVNVTNQNLAYVELQSKEV